ncbi:MAG: folate-binding protein YgfZ [Rhizobiaceae bacterium]
MATVRLDDRAVIDVHGADAEHFLQNLITTDIDALNETELGVGALLTPQGKILFDFLVSRNGEGFRLDCRAATAGDLLRRLTLYKLRARVEISVCEESVVSVSWGDDSPASSGLTDNRFADITVTRAYGTDAPRADRDAADWRTLRIAHGIGESGEDYELGDAFPHDVLFDQNGGVSFTKGCFVGQEVVSRMQHRGTARRRLLIATGSADLPPPGTVISAGGRAIGTLGSVAANKGLAMVRIDRVARAVADGEPVTAGETAIMLAIPAWAGFDFPRPETEES